MEDAMPNLPNWLMPVLRWGGPALALVMAATLVYVRILAPTPEAGTMPEPSAAPVTLYWILLGVGVVATLAGFFIGQKKP
jgi:hypothetical protein